MGETVERCVLCGSTDLVHWKRIDERHIHRCTGCGLAVLNPHPTEEEMFEKYSEYCGYPPKPTDAREKAYWVDLQGGRVKAVGALKPVGRWLDVGSGTGTLLVRARQDGWQVYGCEIASHLVAYAEQEYDLPLYEGTLQEVHSPHRFDVISMYHILEHVASPADLLAAAHERLASDGLLVIEVPNAASLDAQILGKRWNGWSLPVHFYHFTPTTLTRALEICGFQVIRLGTDTSPHWWSRIIRRLARGSHQLRLLTGPTLQAFASKAQIAGAQDTSASTTLEPLSGTSRHRGTHPGLCDDTL